MNFDLFYGRCYANFCCFDFHTLTDAVIKVIMADVVATFKADAIAICV